MDKKQSRNSSRRPCSLGRKRSFKGNRFTIENTTDFTSTSAKKLKDNKELEVNVNPTLNYCIIKFSVIFLTLQQLLKCKECNGAVTFSKNGQRGVGFKLFAGKKIIDIATSISACVFNEGFASLLKIIETMGITIGPQAEQLARNRDARRVSSANRRSTENSKEARTARKNERSEQIEEYERSEGILYGAGIAD